MPGTWAKRMKVIALPCQSYALRSLEPGSGPSKPYLIGTPCSDNMSTEHFHRFLAALLDPQPERIRYLEFCPDYHVELRYEDGPVRRIPFLQLPLQDLGDDFFPLTCQSCVDYTNSLADTLSSAIWRYGGAMGGGSQRPGSRPAGRS